VALFFVIGLMALVAAAGWRWRWVGTPGHSAELLDKAARQLDLAVGPPNAEAITRRLVQRERVALLGGLALQLVVLPFYALYMGHTLHDVHRTSHPTFLPLMLMVPLAGTMLGRQGALTALLIREAHSRSAVPGPRLARAVVPLLTDYVRPLEVWSARLIALVTTPAAAIWCLVAETGTQLGRYVIPSMVAGAVIVATLLALTEVTARRVLDLGQPAANPFELAWDDALRSRQLREVYLLVSGAGVLLTAFCLGPAVPERLTMVPFFATLGLLAVLGLLGKPASHYRRRLWPWPTDAQPA
jgi:hypothetical protein